LKLELPLCCPSSIRSNLFFIW